LLRFARNDDIHALFRVLAARRARVFARTSSLPNQRAQGKPGARCTRGRAWSVVNTRVSHHRFTGTPGLPCAMVLTVSFGLSSVTGLCCHRRLRISFANLTPASGRQDHTTSPSASRRARQSHRLRPSHPTPRP